jgi:hypothetical protein
MTEKDWKEERGLMTDQNGDWKLKNVNDINESIYMCYNM